MSLVVGRVLGGKIVLIGDTQRSKKGSRYHPVLEGWLKVYRVGANMALGFAGNNIEHFADAFASLRHLSSGDQIADAAKRFQEDGYEFDLLVAQADTPYLWVVKSKTVQQCSVGYVGDADAFERYQAAYHWNDAVQSESLDPFAPRPPMNVAGPNGEDTAYSRMMHAFDVVIHDEKVETVGGAKIPLCCSNGRFKYMPYFHVVTGPMPPPPPNVWTQMSFGNAENGSYIIELCASDKNLDEVGIYFPHGNFGVLFGATAKGNRVAHVISASNAAEWELAVSKRTGIGLRSGFLADHHGMLAGEKAMRDDRDEDGVFLYELRDWRNVFPGDELHKERYVSGYANALYNSRRPISALQTLCEYIGLTEKPRAIRTLQAIYDVLPRICQRDSGFWLT